MIKLKRQVRVYMSIGSKHTNMFITLEMWDSENATEKEVLEQEIEEVMRGSAQGQAKQMEMLKIESPDLIYHIESGKPDSNN